MTPAEQRFYETLADVPRNLEEMFKATGWGLLATLVFGAPLAVIGLTKNDINLSVFPPMISFAVGYYGATIFYEVRHRFRRPIEDKKDD